MIFLLLNPEKVLHQFRSAAGTVQGSSDGVTDGKLWAAEIEIVPATGLMRETEWGMLSQRVILNEGVTLRVNDCI